MASERPILIVDDDSNFRSMLKAHLELDGQFAAATAGSLMEAAEKLWARDARYDTVILDVALPDGNGCDFCARLRQEGQKMPIILLTGVTGEEDMVRGLDSGANDYIVKPFRIAEFQARMRAQLRVYENSDHAVFTIGPYTFRPAAKLLQERTGLRRVRLTDKETAILKFLYRAGAETVSRRDLLNEVWGYRATVTTHTLETHIYRLRQKMEPDLGNARLLLTERGGYRLQPNPVLDAVPPSGHRTAAGT